MPMLNLSLNLGLNHDESIITRVYFSKMGAKDEDCQPVIPISVMLDILPSLVNLKNKSMARQFKRQSLNCF